jgi:aminopeptidase
MADLTRVEQYARLIVERSINPQPKWEVLIRSTPLARPLIDALVRLIARRGAYPMLRMNFNLWPIDDLWALEAPEELLAEMAPLDKKACEIMDARITIEAPENTREGSDLTPRRRTLYKSAESYFFRRSMAFDIPWVGCQYPTNAYAQEAGMPLPTFEDFFYGAVLLDWDAERERMARYLERFDAAREVRIVGDETDVRFSIEGRRGLIDDGHVNLPGGEFFFSPNEDSAEGAIYFDVPTEYEGATVEGIRVTFREGRVVEAAAETGNDALYAALDADEGARFVGELGIGCNPGITRSARNILFDEKMDGTVHVAVGASYPVVGGKNQSSVHWDLIKDLRKGGRIELDGEVVQEDGRWLI